MNADAHGSIRVIDSHTGGEPTRVVIDGGPDLGSGSMAERLKRLREKHDSFRSAVVNEPRGSDVLVGAILLPPVDPTCAAGVIFFNNVGYLGMCGHGLIGLIETLAHLGRIGPGEQRIETPVGIVVAQRRADGAVAIRNVRSYRTRRAVAVDVPGHGRVVGDVAWGGNWFFLMDAQANSIQTPLTLAHVETLTDFCWRVRQALTRNGIAGDNGGEIDHIELFAPPSSAAADSRNFVLCPGKAYDRSPCGTGTSAKAACLFADGKLKPGQIWRQESIVGSIFEASVEPAPEGGVIPTVSGRAWIMAEGTLVFRGDDPFVRGIPGT